ncbi:hypothetical protein Dsin_018294 [Dipteronia sinensis]|uniref:PUM-HD domain-containing protein n=1 Tax=Dipteronia sinensis TaxID=43782 RepID=A0AAE0A6L2_9ROSI|nr:hypothetical protein Dsin_018294 [Dipteronia sinensis]
MENPTSASNSSASVQNLSLSLSNLQLNNNGIWADDHILMSNNGGLSMSSTINHSNWSFRGSQANSLYSKIFALATSELGSKYLEELLLSSEDDSRIADNIFYAVFGFLFEFMTDQFAHHVFIKLISSTKYDRLQLITLKLASQSQRDLFLMASSNNYGASSIKKLIELLSISPLIADIVSTLSRVFEHLMITTSGSSIILHCLQVLKNHQTKEPIYQAAMHNFYKVSCHQQGCFSMKNFIKEMRGPRTQQLLFLISQNSVALSKDPYGNYVVQEVIQLENPKFFELTCLALKGQFVDLSMMKSGSHVVEKIMKNNKFEGTIIGQVVNEFLNSNRILKVAKDRFGNYVIQTALKETMRVNRLMYQRLVMRLKQQEGFDSLKFGYGKNVYKFIKASSRFPTC